MAEVKWIKITTDIFDDEKILLIESLPDAYAIIVVWFKLLCLAGKQNNSGVFVMSNKIAYTDRMLATIFRMKESTVTMALQTFEQFGMVEIVDGVITIPNWGKHQNLDQLEAKKEYMRGYMKEYREKQMTLTCKTNSKTNSKTNVSQADKEGDLELRTKKENTSPISPSKGDVTVDNPDLMQERFEQFWSAYPKKVGKGDARKKFLKLKPNQKLFDQILSAVEAAKKTEQWTKNNGQFVPNPATWLNQSRWEDDYSGSSATNSANLDYGEENEEMPF